MEIKKFVINGKEVQFVNSWRKTRNGFAHDSTMFIDGCRHSEATCTYWNRTWESYPYQTVMHRVASNEYQHRADQLRHQFMAEKGYCKMTEKRAVEFDAICQADTYLIFYQAICDAVAAY